MVAAEIIFTEMLAAAHSSQITPAKQEMYLDTFQSHFPYSACSLCIYSTWFSTL